MPIDKFLDIAAEHHTDLDEMIFNGKEEYRNKLSNLLNGVGRDEEIFELLNVSLDITLTDLLNVPIKERDLNYLNVFSQMLSACRLQSFVEIYGIDMISQFENGGKAMNGQAKNMSLDEIKTISSKKDLKTRMAKIREAKYGLE